MEEKIRIRSFTNLDAWKERFVDYFIAILIRCSTRVAKSTP